MGIPLKQYADGDVSRVVCHVHVNIPWWGTMCWLRWCWLMVSKLVSLRRTEETNSSMENRNRMCVLGSWYEGNLCHLHHVVAYAMIVCDRCVSDRVRHIRKCICKSRPKAMYSLCRTLDVICMTRHSVIIDTCWHGNCADVALYIKRVRDL